MAKTVSMYDIIQSGRSRSASLDWFVFTSPEFRYVWSKILEDNDHIILSLAKIKFINPESLVWLAFIVLYRSRNNRSTSISLSREEKLLNFIKFAQFDELKKELYLGFINEFLLPNKSIYHYSNREMQKIIYLNNLNFDRKYKKLSRHVNMYLQKKLEIKNFNEKKLYGLVPFVRTIDEIAENIIKYGGKNGETGEGIISLFPARKNKNYVTYCFSDIGDGFATSLSRKKQNLHIRSEYDAILKGLLYRYMNPENGIYGLYNTMKFIADQYGTLSIMSQNVFVKFDFSNRARRELFINKYENSHGERPSIKWLQDISLKPIYTRNKFPGVHFRITMKFS